MESTRVHPAVRSPRTRRFPAILRVVFLVPAIAGLPSDAPAGILQIVQTGITGAQSQLDVNHSYLWNFTVSGPRTFDSISSIFTLKKGPSSVQDAVMTLWTTDASFTQISQVGSANLSPQSATQAFVAYTFDIAQSSTVLNGSYQLTLKSAALDVANNQWFIKGQTSTVEFLDGTNNPIPGIVTVPEPSSLAVLGSGALVVGVGALCRRWKRRVGEP